MSILGPSRSSQGGRESPTHQRVRRVVQGHLGAECSDVLCRVTIAIVRLKGRESEGPPSGLGGLVLSGNRRCQTIGYRSRDRFESDRRSDFATELAPESGRLRELPRLGAMTVPSQAGLLVTPFAGVPSGEPIVAFIVIVTGYPYLNPLSSLLLTIPLHLIMSSVVLAARRAPAAAFAPAEGLPVDEKGLHFVCSCESLIPIQKPRRRKQRRVVGDSRCDWKPTDK
ncbi:hypothetical protein GW17_00024532 [Ensete ventricosum]|nr:hypothetical protein GW17_00024532 [Ensete ventricosum]